jgi:hypothetical protein
MKFEQTMEELLSPAVMRERLISASIYIAAFESLKESIVSKLRFYYCLDDSKDSQPCESYKKDVMNRNSSAVYASLDWFKGHQAINEDDLAKFEQIKLCRNDLSHRLFNLIGSRGLPQNFEARFHELVELLHKIDLWWVMNIEIPTGPDYAGQEIDESEVKVGSIMAIQMLVDIALGEEDVANSYYEAFKKAQTKNNG